MCLLTEFSSPPKIHSENKSSPWKAEKERTHREGHVRSAKRSTLGRMEVGKSKRWNLIRKNYINKIIEDRGSAIQKKSEPMNVVYGERQTM